MNVTPDQVKSIGDFGVEDSVISDRIEDAEMVVEDSLPTSADEKKKRVLLKWLAAHLVAIREKPLEQMSVGESEYIFQGEAGLGLEHTSYGQQVMVLDTNDALTSKRRHVSTTHGERMEDPLDMDKYWRHITKTPEKQ